MHDTAHAGTVAALGAAGFVRRRWAETGARLQALEEGKKAVETVPCVSCACVRACVDACLCS